eukprot:1325812-Amorphochlora_amoeboformis.AAC.1
MSGYLMIVFGNIKQISLRFQSIPGNNGNPSQHCGNCAGKGPSSVAGKARPEEPIKGYSKKVFPIIG